MESVIAKRYAKALLGLVEANTALEAVAQDLSGLAEAYSSNEDFQLFIKEPKFQLAAKATSMGQITKELGFGELVQKFSRFLISKHRFELIELIAVAFDRLALERLGKGRAQVTASVELSETQLKALAKQLSDYTQKDIALEVTVDPSILGGAITKIGSLVLDGSVKNQLNQIRETISRGT